MVLEISDQILGTFVPIVVYWVVSGIYMLFESSDNYRLHSRKDEDEKNLVSKGTVFRGVLLQQTIQASLGMIVYKTEDDTSSAVPDTIQSGTWIHVVGHFLIAMVVLDSWQYFVHRYLHQNKYLYKHLHSYHHRLVAPYAFGAIYNHPIEGFLIDTIGGTITVMISGMSTRTSMIFFSLTTIKTIDDHCGLVLPGNFLQLLFKNNCAYHDVHHQLYGVKGNFSGPFFVFWDLVLGTHIPFTLEKRVDGGFQTRPINDSKKVS